MIRKEENDDRSHRNFLVVLEVMDSVEVNWDEGGKKAQ